MTDIIQGNNIHDQKKQVEVSPENDALANQNQSGIPRSQHLFDESQFIIKTLSNPATLQNDLESTKVVEHDIPDTDHRSPHYVSVPIPDRMVSSKNSDTDSRKNSITVKIDADRFHENNFVKEYPTMIIEDRFQKWKHVLKGLIIYLREVAYSQEQFGRINTQLKNSVKFSFLTDINADSHKVYDPLYNRKVTKLPQAAPLIEKKSGKVTDSNDTLIDDVEMQDINGSAFSGFMKFGSGSIQDIQVVLKKYHASMASQEFKVSKELTHNIIPELEELRKELQNKCKEIKDLYGDFQTDLESQIAATGDLVNKYSGSIKTFSTANKETTELNPCKDPFLVKVQLDLQIKHQLFEENYLKDAFINLQNSGLQLEKIVYTKIQHVLQYYSFLIDSEARLIIKNLCHELKQGILSQAPATEWDHFVEHHPSSLLPWKSCDPKPTDRRSSEVVYPQIKSPLSKCIRNGYLMKKKDSASKYEKGYFLLTSNFIHEFEDSKFFSTNKIRDSVRINTEQNFQPKTSIALDDCRLARYSENEFTIETTTYYVRQKEEPKSRSSSIPHETNTKSMKTVAKFLKSGSSTKSNDSIPRVTVRRNSLKKITVEEPIYISFKVLSPTPTNEDLMTIKKWIHDVKYLTIYNSTGTRSKYITEKIMRIKLNTSDIKEGNGGSFLPVVTEGNPVQLDYFDLKAVQKEALQERKMSVGAVDPLAVVKSEHFEGKNIGNPVLLGNVSSASPYPNDLSTTESNTENNSRMSDVELGKSHSIAKHKRRSTFGSLGLMKSKSKGQEINETDDDGLGIKLTKSIYS